MISRRSFVLSSAVFPLAAVSADIYPIRPLTWVVPYPAGGFADALARVLAPSLAVELGQPVVIENRPGAGGQIAANYVKLQPADGYTLFMGDIAPFAMNAALYPKLSYETLKDFAPVTRLVTTTQVLVVPPSSPVRNLDDLLTASKTSKGVMYGSFGIGSMPHIWTELLQRETGGTFLHVPYKGAAPALQDLMGGQIHAMLDVAGSSLPYVRAGRLRALAIVGRTKRLDSLPDIPTITELGYPKLEAPGWIGVATRSGTPEPIIERLRAGLGKAVRSDEMKKRFGDFGIDAALQSPREFTQFIRSETDRWGAVIRAAGVVLE